jgi:hypothetical protein
MKINLYLALSIMMAATIPTGSVHGQRDIEADSVLRENAVRLFLDCSFCDINYIRQEIPYVNYVRDVREAQVYLRVNSRQAGNGGREYTITFEGQGEYEGMDDTLRYSTLPDDTSNNTRNGRTQMMKMGLMRYVAKTPLFSEVEINPGTRMESQEVVDRWNNWVFELESRPSVEGQETYKELSLSNSASAIKISNEWKIEIDFDHRYSRTKYTFDETDYVRYRSLLSMDNLIVKSLGEHWSAGARVKFLSSTFNNLKYNFDFFPSLEYNLFPYSQSNDRQLRFLYGFGNSYNMYNDTTIYNMTEENRLLQKLQVAYQVQDKWGSINVSLEGSNYFHDLSKNRLELQGMIQVRIIKGLSFRIYGSVARVNDQLSLVRGETSEADLLLKIQELATAYEFDASFGITYTFGSIYNNIVNPRFGNGRSFYRR